MEMGTATVFGAIIFGALSVVLWAGAFFVLRLIRTPEEILELTGGYLSDHCPRTFVCVSLQSVCHCTAQHGGCQDAAVLFDFFLCA